MLFSQGGEVDPDDDEESSGFLLSQMFDEDVTLAAITGWRIWEASSTFVKLLSGDLVDCIRGRKCIELGCGTGFVGLCAAAAGGHVLLTDVASVVRDSAAHNLRRNSGSEVSASGDGAAAAEWAGARNVGLGTAAATPLDWCKPVGAQASGALPLVLQ